MITKIRRPIYTFIGITLLSFSLSGCIIHVNAKSNDSDRGDSSYSTDLTTTNKSVRVAEGRTVENISSVNGSVSIDDNVTAERVSNTNGQIKIGDNVKVDSVKAVNGQIKIKEGFVSKGDVSTVNGQIKIGENGQVGGELSTVNGSINIHNVVVEKDIVTVNGHIYLKEGSVVKGDIHFRGNNNNNNRKHTPVLYISADSNVEGDIILERPVELELENKSLESKVKRLYKSQ
ncbi:hypothetical protein [Glaciecola sp.]|uniref:hypothetical protein n=1 Tax=Glaciecola sp. MF2-115 TaxID=3384827 RepID=UPI00398954D8